MRPHLIVDCAERSFFALVATKEGETFLCTHESGGPPRRYFSAELLLDPRAGERNDADWDEIGDLLASATPANLFIRLRRLGLRRPWQIAPGEETVRLRHPLQVLSSSEVLFEDEAQKDLPAAAAALTATLLAPVFEALARGGLDPLQLDAVAIVPASYGRTARLLLHKLFRGQGIRRLTILQRETAAAMALMALEDEPSLSGCLVFDVAEGSLHIHRVSVEPAEEGRLFRTTGSRALPGLGWSFWVEHIAAALQEDGRLGGLSGRAFHAIDRGWTGLAGGPYPTEIPTDPSRSLSFGLLQELFSGERAGDLSSVLEERMRPALDDLGWSGGPAIALGAACSISALQDLIASVAVARQPAQIRQMPPLERCVRGVAAALRWQARDPRRHVAAEGGGGLRVDTLRGESVEILSVAGLPRTPGERRSYRRGLRVEGDFRQETSLAVRFLWGCCPEDVGNAWVCTVPLELTAGGSEILEITLDLHRGRRRPRWTGTAKVSNGNVVALGRLRFWSDTVLLVKGEARS